MHPLSYIQDAYEINNPKCHTGPLIVKPGNEASKVIEDTSALSKYTRQCIIYNELNIIYTGKDMKYQTIKCHNCRGIGPWDHTASLLQVLLAAVSRSSVYCHP